MSTIITTASLKPTPAEARPRMRATPPLLSLGLLSALLLATFGAHANCSTDAPEIGDIGPDSIVVCNQLQERFPAAALAVGNRLIHSPTQVSVLASIDGRPIRLRYDLARFVWQLNDAESSLIDAAEARRGLSMRGD